MMDRLMTSGLLMWNSSFDTLNRLLGSTGHLKLFLDDRVVCIGLMERVLGAVCDKEPGTVMAIGDTAWQVAIADAVVRISDFLDETGQPVSTKSLAHLYQITEGKVLPNITSEQAEWFAMVFAQIKPEQPYWCKRFAKFEASQLPRGSNDTTQLPAWAVTDFQKTNFNAIEMIVAWLIYVARDCETAQIQIGWTVNEYENLGTAVPLDIFIDVDTQTFTDVMTHVEDQYKQLIKNLKYMPKTLVDHVMSTSNNLNGKSTTLGVSVVDTQSHDNFSISDMTCAPGSLMTLQINKCIGGFRWIYDANQISREVVNSISLRSLALIESAHIESNAKTPVSKLNLLPKTERDFLLNICRPKRNIQSTGCCLHQLFEMQVERDGSAIALNDDNKRLTYTELNVLANRLAHYLISKGVRPDDRIAFCLERSTTLLVAILGILKTGCAYVPLDPVYPSQRLTNILRDADPVFLITDTTGQSALGNHSIPVIELEKPLPADLSTDNPSPTELGLTSTHLAYIIYTSGSTGTPKGVMVEHQHVVRLFQVTHDDFDFNAQDKWCLFHSISFDFSVWEVWGAFFCGGQLTIVPHKIISFLDDFYNWVCINGITVLSQTPSAFKTLNNAINIDSRSDRLRYVIMGGEEIDQSIAKDWYEKYKSSGTTLVNIYGPTETVIFATYQRLGNTECLHSIGQPVPDIGVYLLDAHGELVPFGTKGEIHVSGAGVARGYLNRPELNAERFLPNPFNCGARMYRTGDLARYLSDGSLIFLGRKDNQVKIRGFRIELGEIEARLIEHPDVRDVTVQTYGNGSDARLVAYVIADADAFSAHNLRAHLLELLPDYMVPAAYVCMPSFPLTSNGKLDRRALPVPSDDAFARQQYEAPQGEMEEKLVQIWRELLNIDRISRHDNFFALGGHSLLVVSLMAELRQIGLDITVRAVFDAPSLSVMAAHLTRYTSISIPPNLITNDSTEITPEMLPLITLSQTDIDAIVAQVPGGVTNIHDIYELTPLQSGMLHHHLMAKEGDVYLLIDHMHFDNRASLERYADAMQQLIERHEILRTAIIWDGLSVPAQVVLRQVPSFLNEIILHDSDKAPLELLKERFNPYYCRLDLTEAPLLRLMASPTSDGSWAAIQLMHHTIIDHASQEMLRFEIHAIMNGKNLPTTTITPFRNFVAKARLGASAAKHKKFFTEMLSDIDEPTLPFGLRDVVQDGSDLSEVRLKLSQTLNDQIRMLTRNLQVSLASVCHLAWARVLAAASGRDAVVFGTVLLGRLQAGDGNNIIVGPLINTLPIRMNINEMSIETSVCSAHCQLSALLSHEHAPLVLAQRCSGVPAGMPLFSAVLNYRHNLKTTENDVSLPGVSFLESVGRTNYPLFLSIDDDDNDNSLFLSAEVTSSISATRICEYMQQSLESIACALIDSPQQPIQNLTVIPAKERSLLLHKWNQLNVSNSTVYCLHQLFEEQAESDGEAVAVECNGQHLTYSQLNVQANRLAHHIIAHGAKPDDRIALCVERSTTMIVGILGILKAGCAYVPLDPIYQSQRLNNILVDANPIFLVADAVGISVLGDHQILLINLENQLSTDLPIDNPDATTLGLTPDHLAYIIYTSGSTGTPKGVMIEHNHVVQYFGAIQNRFGLNRHDTWCMFHSISFDFCVEEIWGALLSGGQLSIVPYHTAGSPNEFYKYICSTGINILGQTPSAFRNLLRADNFSSRFDRLRCIIIGGEELDPIILKEWHEKYDNDKTVLANTYGPTETTVDATIWIWDSNISKNSIAPIGRPLNNKQIYLLGSRSEPVPLGAEGEIYIGGSGIARGYLNRPELTTERFLPDPFNNDPAARMYRAGDLARYLPDGNLVFLGRIDHQVKIRGFRIELGEIEARLVEHPDVQDVALEIFGNGSDARLVAYVIADKEKFLAQNLRKYLLALLPDYMVPAAYVCLPSFPLTPSGKLDRRALPAPEEKSFARQEYEAPLNDSEIKLAQIWCELLQIDRISRHDNFFALGGHSLLVVQLLAKLRKFGLDTTVREVFEAPNLAVLASKLNQYKAVHIPPNLITKSSTNITPEMLPLITLSQVDIDSIIDQVPGGVGNIQDIYGLTPLQNGMLYHHLMAKEGDPYLLESQLSFIDRTSLERYVDAMQQLIERHDILRTAIFWDGLNEPAQVVLRRADFSVAEIKLDEPNECVLQQLCHKFNPRNYRLDLTQAPLLRLMAARDTNESWVALLLMHHTISDHLSDDIMDSEIRAIMNGEKRFFTAPIPFRHFVAQIRLGFHAAEHKRFFAEMLGDIDEPTLPFGLSNVDQSGSEINEVHVELPQALNDQLRALARNLQVSLASICHLAWAQVLAKTSGREAVVFGTLLLGRLEASGKSNVIMGPMINTLPIRFDIDERSVEIAVHDMYARLSALLAHENAPLVLAQRCSGVPAGMPLFSALMNYRHNQEIEGNSKQMPGVTVIKEVERTNYPLNLSVEDNFRSLGLTTQAVSSISAARICAYMQQSLESIAYALTFTPQQSIQKLTVIPPEERALVLHKWNQTIVHRSPIRCLHQLFEAQAEYDGDAIAVEYKERVLSYAELNIKANRLAHYIIARGVKPDDRIALCVERSTDLTVAMMGILKAGCAYVPLDPVYPSQRLTNILLDADPILLVADSVGLAVLGEHKVPVIDMGKPMFSNLTIDDPKATELNLTPDHLAYIIYTSGSTGKPKGVMVEHKSVVRFFEALYDQFDFNKRDIWCMFHSISFDISVWEIFSALCYGSQLSIAPYQITSSTDEFYDWICTRGVTVLTQTSTALKMLIRAKNTSLRFNPVRFIAFGAESSDSSIIKDWYENDEDSQTVLAHMYGPTESLMVATSWICGIDAFKDAMMPIGRPLQNRKTYLLDSLLEPVPIGVDGELYIGGNSIARGYLNRCELSAERFLSDPFSEVPSARMYRTGDLARYLPDGNLVYAGRIDEQVKIRGFRIEVGEIEARLVEHPQVREAVVQPYNNGTDTRLVAYIVAISNESLAQNLRAYLMTLLPDYMVPAAYVCLPSLPLTSNGKLDRRGLPIPGDDAFARQQYEAPQGEMEEKLIQIWRELLNIDRISRHDNFFALGGHSLLVIRLLAQLRHMGLDTTAREVFAAPTLAMLATMLIQHKAVAIPPNLITKDSTEITPEMLPLITLSQTDIDSIIDQVPGGVANIQDIYELTPLQNGMLYHHLMAKAGDPYLLVNQIRFIDRTTLERYANAVQRVIERHDILRTSVFWDGLSESVQVVLRQVPPFLNEIKLNESDTTPFQQLTQRFNPCHYKLELNQAPLVRLMAAPGSEGSWAALQLMHHSIIDHSTQEIFQAEIYAIMNEKIETLTTPIPFRNFVAQFRLGIREVQHTRFFTEMLGDIDAPTLPFGLSNTDQDGSEINEVHLHKLPPTLNDQLRALARNSKVSLASVCHLAWAKVLAAASGREAIIFGTVLLGRLQAGEGNSTIMGPMINLLPLRLDFDEKSIKTAVQHAHDRLSALLSHEHAPLVLAQRCSGVPAGLPLFSSILNYRHLQMSIDIDSSLPGISFLDNVGQTNYPLSVSLDDDDRSLCVETQVVSSL